ncbi:MAG: hypothetical protein K9H25_21585, partial [Rhodospirillum sp.]|nr:hypothetical protein [Rhodospirillum sp.]
MDDRLHTRPHVHGEGCGCGGDHLASGAFAELAGAAAPAPDAPPGLDPAARGGGPARRVLLRRGTGLSMGGTGGGFPVG